MFYCPVCKKEYDNDAAVARCFLRCWSNSHSTHRSKNAPRTPDRVERICTPEIENFFNNLKGVSNG